MLLKWISWTTWGELLCSSWRLLVTRRSCWNGNVDRTTELHQLKTNYQVLLTTTITSHHLMQGQKKTKSGLKFENALPTVILRQVLIQFVKICIQNVFTHLSEREFEETCQLVWHTVRREDNSKIYPFDSQLPAVPQTLIVLWFIVLH